MAEQTPTKMPNVNPPSANSAPAEQPRAAQRRADDQRAAQDKARSDAEKKLDDQEKARQDQIAETQKSEGQMKPTPTQRENDLAKLGHPVDEKEDDGSGPEKVPGAVRRDATADDAGRYRTRDVTK